MRVRIKFQNIKTNFSYDYREEFINYIERVAYFKNREIHQLLFSNGHSLKYCFSIYFKRAYFYKRNIFVPKFSDIYMTFSMDDEYLNHIEVLMNCIGENDMYVDGLIFKDYLVLKSPLIQDNQVFIEMLSPLILKDELSAKYIDCTSNEFKTVASFLLEKEIFQFDKRQVVKLIPVKASKTVIKCKGKCINASLGQYLLIADSSDAIKTFYNDGIGCIREEGFGLFQVINNN